jgi:endonuclease/exonuclease/phosphatase (EEP) superfamily protein YafD
MRWRDEYRGLATAFGLIVALVLLGASVDFGVPGQEILQSLRFHIALAGLGAALALVVGGARWRALLMFAVVAVSVVQGLLPFWQVHQRRDPLVAGTVVGSLDLLSFNVLTRNSRAREVADYLVASPPDIAVIMETPGIEAYLPELAATYPYRIGCENTRTCDTSILSTLERLITAKVDVDGQVVTIVATHLSKPYFDGLSDVELEELAERLNDLDGPLILAGDFNAAAWSDALIRLANASDLVPPSWPPATWPVRASVAGVPIDNVFTRGNALIGAIAALPDAMGSNHRGLRARINIVAP